MVRFLFKQPRPKRFAFKPRFYDETKEYIKAREEVIRREIEGAEGASSENAMRQRMSSSWRSGHAKKARSRSNKNVLLITALLLIVAYFLLIY